MSLFTVTENDKRIYEEQIRDYLPDKIIDIHTHGCLGNDSSAAITYDTIDKMSRFYASNGVTTYPVTIVIVDFDETLYSHGDSSVEEYEDYLVEKNLLPEIPDKYEKGKYQFS